MTIDATRSATATTTGPAPAHDRKLLGIYLSDHSAGASMGTDRMNRLARAERDSVDGAELLRIATENEEDAASLTEIMGRLGVERQQYKRAIAWVAEQVAPLKLNGRIFRRSPLTPLIELEMMQMALAGKQALWATLQRSDLQTGADLEALVERAKRQRKTLQQVHQRRAATVFDTPG